MDLAESAIAIFEEKIRETDKAVQLKFSAGSVEWLPKSQIRIVDKFVYLPEWLVKEKNLNEFIQ